MELGPWRRILAIVSGVLSVVGASSLVCLYWFDVPAGDRNSVLTSDSSAISFTLFT
jgi:hypothetical protein